MKKCINNKAEDKNRVHKHQHKRVGANYFLKKSLAPRIKVSRDDGLTFLLTQMQFERKRVKKKH